LEYALVECVRTSFAENLDFEAPDLEDSPFIAIAEFTLSDVKVS